MKRLQLQMEVMCSWIRILKKNDFLRVRGDFKGRSVFRIF
jgi:hypothetical protein